MLSRLDRLPPPPPPPPPPPRFCTTRSCCRRLSAAAAEGGKCSDLSRSPSRPPRARRESNFEPAVPAYSAARPAEAAAAAVVGGRQSSSLRLSSVSDALLSRVEEGGGLAAAAATSELCPPAPLDLGFGRGRRFPAATVTATAALVELAPWLLTLLAPIRAMAERGRCCLRARPLPALPPPASAAAAAAAKLLAAATATAAAPAPRIELLRRRPPARRCRRRCGLVDAYAILSFEPPAAQAKSTCVCAQPHDHTQLLSQILVVNQRLRTSSSRHQWTAGRASNNLAR
jgi:hypothetical protein